MTAATSDAALKALRDAVKGLTYPSESDKPIKAFLWKEAAGGDSASAAVAADALTAAARLPAGAHVKPLALARFWDPVTTEQSWWGDTEKATAAQFHALQDALTANLTNLTAYRVSGAAADRSTFDLYVVGRTAEGDLAGISTQVVET